jgi:hypothetical protein
MIKQKIIQKTVTLLFLLIPIFKAIAQENEFEDDVQDVPAAPIDSYIFVAIVIAIYIAYQFIKNQQVKNKIQ